MVACCFCGGPAKIREAVEAELDRREEEEFTNITVPPIGVLCDSCELK